MNKGCSAKNQVDCEYMHIALVSYDVSECIHHKVCFESFLDHFEEESHCEYYKAKETE